MIGIIFSRDRAFQLDGTLRSLLWHCQDTNVLELFILYKATSEKHMRQYEQLKKQYTAKNIRFLAERSFKEDILKLLFTPSLSLWEQSRTYLSGRLGEWFGHPFSVLMPFGRENTILFLVDDNIFVRAFRLAEVTAALDANSTVLGFSLRLGPNTSYCYPLDQQQTPPDFRPVNDHVLEYHWGGAEGDFGYPLEVSSSIYRIKELLPLLVIMPYTNPNQLEAQLARRAKKFRRKAPLLACFRQSVTFCNPVNRVQTVLNNRVGSNQEFSNENLANMFDADYRLDVDAYKDFVPVSCHQEVDLTFRKVL